MTTRIPLIAGNWKMHKTGPEAVESARKLASMIADAVNPADVMIAPVFTALPLVAQAVIGSPIRVGAQNLHWEAQGAYTGEISATMLKAAGCTDVIIGHSERRQLFGETDAQVNQKIGAALAAGLHAVVCIGETEAEREAKQTLSVLDKQLKIGLQSFALAQAQQITIAYEPVWAIGTGKTATDEQAQEAHAFIRQKMAEIFDEATATGIQILYGGSVKPANVKGLMAMPDIDGALVGGASLDPEVFFQLIDYRN